MRDVAFLTKTLLTTNSTREHLQTLLLLSFIPLGLVSSVFEPILQLNYGLNHTDQYRDRNCDGFWKWVRNSNQTKLYSSTMCTAHFSGRLFGGRGSGRRKSLSGGECLPHPHPPVDRQAPVKILPCPKLRLRAVIIVKYEHIGNPLFHVTD